MYSGVLAYFAKTCRCAGLVLGPLCLLGLSACSWSVVGGADQASLAYQNEETNLIQSEVRAGLFSSEKNTPPKKEPVKKAPKTPKFDPVAAQKLINAYRISKGLPALKLHPKLTQAAKNHSRDLSRLDKISHYGSDGSNPWQRVEKTGYKPKVAAENVGTGQFTIKEVVKGWKESPSHNQNLLMRDASHMGIAMIHKPQSHRKTFWTLVLGSPM